MTSVIQQRSKADGSTQLSLLQSLKISCLSRGIRITKEAEDRLTEGGTVPLSIHEYATTGGITLELEGAVFINAPFDEWFCDNPEVVLDIDRATQCTTVHFKEASFPARVLPLPGYLETRDSQGRPVRDVVMSHVDRARLSPIAGCSFSCQFCDSSITRRYEKRPLEQLQEAMAVARHDALLPITHALISGGTPRPSDYVYTR